MSSWEYLEQLDAFDTYIVLTSDIHAYESCMGVSRRDQYVEFAAEVAEDAAEVARILDAELMVDLGDLGNQAAAEAYLEEIPDGRSVVMVMGDEDLKSQGYWPGTVRTNNPGVTIVEEGVLETEIGGMSVGMAHCPVPGEDSTQPDRDDKEPNFDIPPNFRLSQLLDESIGVEWREGEGNNEVSIEMNPYDIMAAGHSHVPMNRAMLNELWVNAGAAGGNWNFNRNYNVPERSITALGSPEPGTLEVLEMDQQNKEVVSHTRYEWKEWRGHQLVDREVLHGENCGIRRLSKDILNGQPDQGDDDSIERVKDRIEELENAGIRELLENESGLDETVSGDLGRRYREYQQGSELPGSE